MILEQAMVWRRKSFCVKKMQLHSLAKIKQDSWKENLLCKNYGGFFQNSRYFIKFFSLLQFTFI